MGSREIAKLGGEGILTEADIPKLQEATHRLERYMLEVESGWVTHDTILRVTGQREGMRRLRELRELHTIERRRIEPGREFEYRIAPKVPDGL